MFILLLFAASLGGCLHGIAASLMYIIPGQACGGGDCKYCVSALGIQLAISFFEVYIFGEKNYPR